MKLEVGMYVRTKNGYIRKIDRIWNDTDFNVDKIYYNDNIDEDTLGCVLDEDISKASHNIIDLIEVGDYVNGWRVNNVEREEDGVFLTIGTLTNFVSKNETDPYLTQDHYEANMICKITSIVTKECFESMSYEVSK